MRRLMYVCGVMGRRREIEDWHVKLAAHPVIFLAEEIAEVWVVCLLRQCESAVVRINGVMAVAMS